MAGTQAKLSFDEMMQRLESLANPAKLAGMARFGIRPAHALGTGMPALRELARGQRDHALALRLWETGIHEARILAALVDIPAQVTPEQMEGWVQGFDSWDVCDQVCSSLFDRTPYAVEKALEWAERDEEFVRRAGFVLMAAMAVHNKKAPDTLFLPFLPVILRHSTDSRNFVKKAINWALRQIGKRSPSLYQPAIQTALQIGQIDSPTARWIAKDALHELESRRLPA
jgi:3-methyladenine DNA glycosylase AlkD